MRSLLITPLLAGTLACVLLLPACSPVLPDAAQRPGAASVPTATSPALGSEVAAGAPLPLSTPPPGGPDTTGEAYVRAQRCPGPPTWRPAADRVIAIGDLHGDVDALLAALRLAGVADSAGRWVGGRTVVVIVGDVLDRGDQEEALLDTLARLSEAAAAAGGAVLPLLGNHELMNAYGDLRYVTPGGASDFDAGPGFDPGDPRWRRVPGPLRARAAAFAPGAARARQLAGWNTLQVVGDTLFVHGAVLEAHVERGLGAINCEIRAWLNGAGPLPRSVVRGPEAPVWTRAFSLPDAPPDCARLAAILRRLGVQRMVVGHTPQRDGVTSACGGKVWRVDVGLARHYGGPIEVLVVDAAGARSLRAPTRPD